MKKTRILSVVLILLLAAGIRLPNVKTVSAAAKNDTKLTVTIKNNNTAVLKWKKIKGVKKYRIVYNTYYASGWKTAKKTSKLKCSIKLNYATPYKIRIDCPDNKGNLHSNTVNFETGSDPSLAYERVCSLKSYKVNKYYNAASTPTITFVEDDLWYLKGATSAAGGAPYDDYFPMVLGQVKNYASVSKTTQNPSVTFHVIKNPDGSLYYAKHASSMEYVDGSFYIVTCGTPDNESQVIKVNQEGIVESEINIRDNNNSEAFSNLAYIGRDDSERLMFMSRCGKGNRTFVNGAWIEEPDKISQKLQRLVLDGQELVPVNPFPEVTENISEQYPIPDWYTQNFFPKDLHCNDVCYDAESDIFYMSTFVYDNGSRNITQNQVLGYSATTFTEMESLFYKGDQTYKYWFFAAPKYQGDFGLASTNTSETKFEVEGLAFHDGSLYLGVNANGIEDALYRVKTE